MPRPLFVFRKRHAGKSSDFELAATDGSWTFEPCKPPPPPASGGLRLADATRAGLHLHQAPGGEAGHVAQDIRIGGLPGQGPQVRPLVGDRQNLGWCSVATRCCRRGAGTAKAAVADLKTTPGDIAEIKAQLASRPIR